MLRYLLGVYGQNVQPKWRLAVDLPRLLLLLHQFLVDSHCSRFHTHVCMLPVCCKRLTANHSTAYHCQHDVKTASPITNTHAAARVNLFCTPYTAIIKSNSRQKDHRSLMFCNHLSHQHWLQCYLKAYLLVQHVPCQRYHTEVSRARAGSSDQHQHVQTSSSYRLT